MGFNYGKEKIRFVRNWSKLAEEYRTAGFEEAGIEAMREYDWEVFRKRRTYENREQDMPSEVLDGGDDSHSTLLRKFSSLTGSFDESDLTGRYDWIESIDNAELAGELKRLSDEDKELLTLLAFDGYTQTEIAEVIGLSQVAIHKRIKKVKNILQKWL